MFLQLCYLQINTIITSCGYPRVNEINFINKISLAKQKSAQCFKAELDIVYGEIKEIT